MQSVNKDMQLKGWSFVVGLNFSESGSREIMKAFDYFCYINGRFPKDNDLVSAPYR